MKKSSNRTFNRFLVFCLAILVGITSFSGNLRVVKAAEDVLLSQGKPTTRSTDSGQAASKAVDGDTSTFWSAKDGTMPQWLQVDLGAVYNLSKIDIIWRTETNKGYTYYIEASNDNVTYHEIVDKRTNTINTSTSDDISDVEKNWGRYIKINITGSTLDSGGISAKIYELKVYGNPTPVVGVESVSLDTATKTIAVGESFSLIPAVLPENAIHKGLTWTSDNESVAIVDNNGVVKGLIGGTATITATSIFDSTKKASSTVTVEAPVGSITLDPASKNIEVGSNFTLTPVFPAGMTNKALTWISSDPSVATVDNNGLVNALKAGTTNITAALVSDPSKMAVCTVTVKEVLLSQGKTVTANTNGGSSALPEFAVDGDDTTKWNANNATMPSSGNLYTNEHWLKVDLGAVHDLSKIDINWGTGDRGYYYKIETSIDDGTYTEIINKRPNTLTNDTSDTVSTIGRYVKINIFGTHYRGKTPQIYELKVYGSALPKDGVAFDSKTKTINVGSSFELTPTIISDVTDKSLTWTSSDSAVATVDENGVVNALKAGTVTIKAVLSDESKPAAVCTVTVKIGVTGITLNKTSATIVVGGTENLISTVAPADATDTSIIWSSSNPAVASVDAKGTVTANKEGVVQITAKTTDGNFTAVCDVMVTPADSVEVPISITEEKEINLDVDYTQEQGQIVRTEKNHDGAGLIDDPYMTSSLNGLDPYMTRNFINMAALYTDPSKSIEDSINSANVEAKFTGNWQNNFNKMSNVSDTYIVALYPGSEGTRIPSAMGNNALDINYDEFEKVSYQWLKTAKQKNAKLEYIECINEPDLSTFNKDSKTTVPFENYMELYKRMVNVVNRVNAEVTNGKPLKVGGPIVSDIKEGNMNYIFDFIDAVKNEGLKMDFVAWHHYDKDARGIATATNRIKAKLQEAGLNAETIISEIGWKGGSLGNSLDKNPDNIILAKQAALINDAAYFSVDSEVDIPINWTPTHTTADWKNEFLKDASGNLKTTPFFNVLKARSWLGDARVSATGGSTEEYGVRILATKNSTDKISMIISNYQGDNTVTYNANINVRNLPEGFAGKNIRYKAYLIDNTHSNMLYGSGNEELQLYKEMILEGGSAKSLNIQLTQNAVMYIELSATDEAFNTIVSGGREAVSSSNSEDANRAIDGNSSTRWTASNYSYPQWWKIDLGKQYNLTAAEIKWTNSALSGYKYKVETSTDDSSYETAVDHISSVSAGDTFDRFAKAARYVKVTVTGSNLVVPASIDDIKIYAPAESGVSVPKLADLKVNGMSIGGFNPELNKYTVVLSENVSSADIEAVARTNATASPSIKSDIQLTDDGKTSKVVITVTSNDGSSSNYYTVNVRKVSSIKTLSSIKVSAGDNPVIIDDKYDYSVNIPASFNDAEILAAVSNGAEVGTIAEIIVQPDIENGQLTGKILVTAESGITQEYTINFVLGDDVERGKVLLYDDFEDGNIDGWNSNPANKFSVKTISDNKVLSKSIVESGNNLATTGDSTWSDYTVEANVKVTSPKTLLGIVARATDDGKNFYMLRIRPIDGWVELNKSVNGVLSTDSTDPTLLTSKYPYAAEEGKWYSLRMVLKGNSIKGYLNDKLIIDATDSSLQTGKAGVRVSNGSAIIDNFMVTENVKPIVSIEAPEAVEVIEGLEPELPATVIVTYDDNTTGELAVTWDSVDTATAGDKTVTGTVQGYSNSVSITVKVILNHMKSVVIPAVAKAEGSQNQSDVDAARALVNALSDGNDKTSLIRRLEAVQRIIDERSSGDITEQPLEEPTVPAVPPVITVPPVTEISTDDINKLNEVIGDKNIKVVEVNIKPEAPVVEKSLFDAIKGTDKVVIFNNKAADGSVASSWSFDGKAITNDVQHIDLTIKFESPKQEEIKQAAAIENIFVVSFNHHGDLPGTAKISVKIVSKWLQGKDKNNITLYYFNADTKRLEIIAENLKVDDKGYVKFSLDHCSDYVLLAKKDAEIINAKNVAIEKSSSLVNEALKEKIFYYYNVAYYEVMQLPEGKDKDLLLAKLSSISNFIWTDAIKDINRMIDELVSTASGKIYDEIQVVIQNANISYIDKAYLLGEVTSWGKKLVWTPDYVKAVDLVVKAWSQKDAESIDNAKNSVEELKNHYSKEYLLEEISKIK